MSEITQLLKHISLFRGLNEKQLDRVAQITHSEAYDAHKLIFDQGDEGDNMYIIDAGQVEIRVHDRSGGTSSVLILGQGQIFGEMALIDHGERSASVVALQPNTRVYAIPKDAFEALCESDTAIGYVMMRNIAQDLSIKIRHQNLFS
jgi:CRP-like cAMP-binding protein